MLLLPWKYWCCCGYKLLISLFLGKMVQKASWTSVFYSSFYFSFNFWLFLKTLILLCEQLRQTHQFFFLLLFLSHSCVVEVVGNSMHQNRFVNSFFPCTVVYSDEGFTHGFNRYTGWREVILHILYCTVAITFTWFNKGWVKSFYLYCSLYFHIHTSENNN